MTRTNRSDSDSSRSSNSSRLSLGSCACLEIFVEDQRSQLDAKIELATYSRNQTIATLLSTISDLHAEARILQDVVSGGDSSPTTVQAFVDKLQQVRKHEDELEQLRLPFPVQYQWTRERIELFPGVVSSFFFGSSAIWLPSAPPHERYFAHTRMGEALIHAG